MQRTDAYSAFSPPDLGNPGFQGNLPGSHPHILQDANRGPRGMKDFVALAVLAVLGACSPYRLANSVGSFQKSIASSEAALDTGLTNLRADMASNRTARLVATRAQVETSKACGFSSTADDNGNLHPPCVLLARNEAEPAVSPVLQDEAATRRKMEVLLRYADALKAISNADNSKALKSATDKLAGSASALVVAAAPAGPQAAAAGAAAATTLAAAIEATGTAVRIGLDAQRMAVLRRTVGDTNNAVKSVATGIGSYFDTVRLARIEQVQAETNFRAERLGRGPDKEYASDFATTQQKLDVLNALRDANGAAVGEDIATAHEKLVKAANDETGGPAEFAAAVGELAAAVQKLRAAMEAQGKVGATTKSGA